MLVNIEIKKGGEAGTVLSKIEKKYLRSCEKLRQQKRNGDMEEQIAQKKTVQAKQTRQIKDRYFRKKQKLWMAKILEKMLYFVEKSNSGRILS